MPKIKTMADLTKIREQAQRDLQVREKAGTQIIVGMGTCGIAAGARETMRAILDELAERDLEVNVTTVGCIGMCTGEPLVDIVQPETGRITYGNITADRVPTLIEEHVIKGNVIRDWVIGQVTEGTE